MTIDNESKGSCRICSARTEKILKKKILNKYLISYFSCTKCGIIQTEKAYWLKEAYASAITSLDIGLINRNNQYSGIAEDILYKYFNKNAKFLDFAGGYGMFTRIMRDKGFDFYHEDKHCDNLFAKHFEINDLKNEDKKFELITAFELMEHIENPFKELDYVFSMTDNFLFSTELVPSENIENWWYLGVEHGQHITFYTKKSLERIAEKYGKEYYSNGYMHLFTNKKNIDIFKGSKLNLSIEEKLLSKTQKDFEFVKNSIISDKEIKKEKCPRVSIITVCYNEENGIEDTCKSVIAQNYNNYEWIVIDGGSTDKTLEILDKYKSNISVLISEKDNGVYDAMNKGIKLAKGEYLLFLNGGDFLFKNSVLGNIFSVNLYEGDILYGNCCVLKKHEKSVILDFPRKTNKYFFINDCINHQSTFIKKELFEKHGYYDESYKILADFERWLCFMKNSVMFKKIPFIVSNFKNFDGLSSSEKTRNLTQKEKKRAIKKYFKWYEILFNKLLKYRIKIPIKIKFIVFSPKKFIFKYWYKILNSILRQPIRKIWYFVKNEKLDK